MRSFMQWLESSNGPETHYFFVAYFSEDIGGYKGPGEGNDLADPEHYRAAGLPPGTIAALHGIHYHWNLFIKDHTSDPRAVDELLMGHAAYVDGSYSGYQHDYDNRGWVVAFIPADVAEKILPYITNNTSADYSNLDMGLRKVCGTMEEFKASSLAWMKEGRRNHRGNNDMSPYNPAGGKFVYSGLADAYKRLRKVVGDHQPHYGTKIVRHNSDVASPFEYPNPDPTTGFFKYSNRDPRAGLMPKPGEEREEFLQRVTNNAMAGRRKLSGD